MAEWFINFVWHAILGLFMLGVLSAVIAGIANAMLFTFKMLRKLFT